MGKTIQKYNLEKGINTIEFKAKELQSGIYYYSLVADKNVVANIKLMLLK